MSTISVLMCKQVLGDPVRDFLGEAVKPAFRVRQRHGPSSHCGDVRGLGDVATCLGSNPFCHLEIPSFEADKSSLRKTVAEAERTGKPVPKD